MDFLGETIAESYRTGKMRNPNRNNKLSKSRSKFRMKMEKEAASRGKDVEEVALGYIEQNAGQIQKYILSKGELPQDENPAALAVQAYELRSQEVNDIAQAMDCDYDTAEAYLDEAENKAMELNSPEADSFIGELFEAVGNIAGKAAAKGAQKRKKEGKKPGVAGFFAELLSPGSTESVEDWENENQKLNLKLEAQNLFNKIKENEKKKEIKKMLPMIIIGVVVLIVIVVLITKKTSK
jgi:hypothetical protein